MQEDVNNLKINVAVINNKLDNLDKKQDTIITILEKHIADEEVNRQMIMSTKADTKQVEKLEDNQRWVVRTIIAGFLTALGTLIYNINK